MGHYTLKRVSRIPISLDEAWDFFSSPKNLKEITPEKVGFNQLSNSGSDKMYEGQLITYTVSPILGIPIFWMTEITHVHAKKYFIDEQRYGPYAMWNHSHFFKEIKGGVEMTDLVQYKMPLGFIGRLGHTILVKKQLDDIFAFREKRLIEKFGPPVPFSKEETLSRV